MRRLVLLLGALALPVACAPQEGARRAALTSPSGGTTLEASAGRLPAEAVGFTRGGTFWLEADRPGQGAAVEYAGPSRAAVATVSLYDLSLIHI